MNQIIMLGTGNATVTQCYNTCFLLETSTTRLLVDAGGGNGVLRQLQRAGVAIRDLHHLFVTHAHTDHVLGVIWVIRMVAQCKDYEGHLHVYGHDKVLLVLRTIIDMILAKKQLARVAQRVVFHQLEDGDRFPVGDMTIQCFDIHSTKEKQYGFRAELPRSVSPASASVGDPASPLVVACLGDEPYNPANRPLVEQADWLMAEASASMPTARPSSPTRRVIARPSTPVAWPPNWACATSSSTIPRRRRWPHARWPMRRRQPSSMTARSSCPTTWR